MPTYLPSGTVVYNMTPHSLQFWVGGEEEIVVAPSDGVLSAAPHTKNILINSRYTLVSVKFQALNVGREMIERIKNERADALIVGSFIAAQAYPGDVVAPVPYEAKRDSEPMLKKVVRSDRFTVFPQENKNGSN